MEVGKYGAFLEADLSFSDVVENRVDAGDNTACVVEHFCLFHVELAGDGHVTPHSVSGLLQELGVDDDSKAGLWDKGEKVLIKAIDLTETPRLLQAAPAHVFLENFRVAFERRPVEGNFVCFSSGLLVDHLILLG